VQQAALEAVGEVAQAARTSCAPSSVPATASDSRATTAALVSRMISANRCCLSANWAAAVTTAVAAAGSGRVTYAEWAGYWPGSTDEPFASWINGIPKYVASGTLESVGWSNCTLIKGPLAGFVRDLREQPGGTIGVAGSPSVVRSLLAEGLLDELTLMISPVVAGGGRKRLFPADSPLTSLTLVEAGPTSSGALIATYRPAR